MQQKTKSILETLTSLYHEHNDERDRRYLIESRASNVIASAIRLLEEIDKNFPVDQAENLSRKLLNAIRDRDPGKFIRTVRRSNVD